VQCIRQFWPSLLLILWTEITLMRLLLWPNARPKMDGITQNQQSFEILLSILSDDSHLRPLIWSKIDCCERLRKDG
jgi:hypothetical protein